MKTNRSAFDLFTIAHFSIGIWAARWFTPVQVAVLMTLWEIAEHPLKNNFPQFFPCPGQDIFANSAVDVLSAYAGAYLSRQVMKKEGIL